MGVETTGVVVGTAKGTEGEEEGFFFHFDTSETYVDIT